MRIIAKKTLRIFWEAQAWSQKSLQAWHDTVKAAKWKTSDEMVAQLPGVSSLGGDCFIFKRIKGNDIRLIANIDFNHGVVFIKFVGTHAEYDKLKDAREVCE